MPERDAAIRMNTTVARGNVPAQWIRDQIEVLNDSHAGRTGGGSSGFRFRARRRHADGERRLVHRDRLARRTRGTRGTPEAGAP